jgi:hypothetical protein
MTTRSIRAPLTSRLSRCRLPTARGILRDPICDIVSYSIILVKQGLRLYVFLLDHFGIVCHYIDMAIRQGKKTYALYAESDMQKAIETLAAKQDRSFAWIIEYYLRKSLESNGFLAPKVQDGQ